MLQRNCISPEGASLNSQLLLLLLLRLLWSLAPCVPLPTRTTVLALRNLNVYPQHKSLDLLGENSRPLMPGQLPG